MTDRNAPGSIPESFALTTAAILIMSSVGIYVSAPFAARPRSRAAATPPAVNASVESLTTDAKVLEVYPSTGVHLLAYRPKLTVYFDVRNTGRQTLGPMGVKLKVMDDSVDRQAASYERSLPPLEPGGMQRVVFVNVPSNQGSVNSLTAMVMPSGKETDLQDNTRTLKYVMNKRVD